MVIEPFEVPHRAGRPRWHILGETPADGLIAPYDAARHEGGRSRETADALRTSLSPAQPFTGVDRSPKPIDVACAQVGLHIARVCTLQKR
jgi:hypothetical protein